MRKETTQFGVKDVATLEPGEYEVEFLREQHRTSSGGIGHNAAGGAAVATAQRQLPSCILRVVATGEEVEDISRAVSGWPVGTRFVATVEQGDRYAAFKPKV